LRSFDQTPEKGSGIVLITRHRTIKVCKEIIMATCKTLGGKPLLYWVTLATIMVGLTLAVAAGGA
jgi:hypothetical protein